MITTKNQALAGVATAAIVLAQSLALPALSASATRLTAASAAAVAKSDAMAAAAIYGGDTAKISGCHAVRGGAYTCQVELIPVRSNSRCRWTDTIRLVKGKPTVVKYTAAHCTN
ncbi:MAG TPA: hypothetical protein VFR49_12320 [Solirubrobacteraceae bacterium]|nr:hypothetical protein [Solirubrobacteraceae bacterium]